MIHCKLCFQLESPHDALKIKWNDDRSLLWLMCNGSKLKNYIPDLNIYFVKSSSVSAKEI